MIEVGLFTRIDIAVGDNWSSQARVELVTTEGTNVVQFSKAWQ